METRLFIAWLWLLSGMPVGIALLLMPRTAAFTVFTVFIILSIGHTASPIVLAWTHQDFRRQVLYRKPLQFIGVPVAVLTLTLSIGYATQLGWTSYQPRSPYLPDWKNPLTAVLWIYWVAQTWHYGMQHFGISRLLRAGSPRWVSKVLCIAGTAFCLVIMPAFAGPQTMVAVNGAFDVNHWITDIGLSARVMGRRWWVCIVGVTVLGAIGLTWLTPTADGIKSAMLPMIITWSIGLSFVHYLYSRWVWTTVGRDLLRQGEAASAEQMALT
jgi:hypothetical protein